MTEFKQRDFANATGVVVAFVLMCAAGHAQLAHQVLVDLPPSDDAHTHNLSPTMNFGATPTLIIGKFANSPLEVYRGHFRFNLSSLGAAPAIARAELHWYQTSSSGGGLEVDLHVLNASWSEGSITWNNQPAPGAELINQDIGGPAGWYIWDITCLARDWASGTQANFGVVIKDPESTAGAFRPGTGVSKEGTMAQRPFLRVLANTGYGAEIGAPRGATHGGDVPLTFRLVDPGAGSSSVAISFSTDGGVSYSPASINNCNGAPLGALCRVHWDSVASGVGLSGVVAVRVLLDFSGPGVATLNYDFMVDNRPPCACVLSLPPIADVHMTNRNECEPPGQNPLMIMSKERNSPPKFNRNLFAFDLSHIPAGTPVVSAVFNYYQYDGGGAGGLPVDLHRVTAPWLEETVTWATTPAWNPTVVTSVSVGDVFNNGYQFFSITALVQDWIDGVQPNHGFLIKDDEITAGASRQSYGYAREYNDPTRQPFLALTLGAPPASCLITAPRGTSESGDVTIAYTAFSPTSSLATITPSFSTNGGATWSPAAPGVGGDGVTGLTTSPSGIAHTFVWDSAFDIPGALGATAVDFEILLDDGASTFVCDTDFTVDNTPLCTVPLCGDCNGDLLVTILDALVAAQHAAGLTTLSGGAFSSCNVQGLIEPDPAAEVSVLDALTLAQFAAGLPVALVCC